ncbi:MAG: hypothetical protein ABFC56_16445 [Clostridiaceae bacterium]
MLKKAAPALALIVAFFCLACTSAPKADASDTAGQTAATTNPTAAPTPVPTAEPTPSPTPEPVFVETALSEKLFTNNKVTASVTGARFSENFMTSIDLSIKNASAASVSLKLDGVCLNDWQVEGVLQDGEQIAAGETRTASVVVNFVDNPNASYMGISSLAGFTLDFYVVDDAIGKNIGARLSKSVAMPDAVAITSPADTATLVYEDKNLAIYLQGIDGTLQHTRALLYKKPNAAWRSAMIDPIYAGYTNFVNRAYTVDEGKYLLLALDGTDVMTRQNITTLTKLDLYLTLTQYDGRLNRPVCASIVDPNVSETVMNAPDAGPIVYQSDLSYFILRNMGITQFEGHEAILLDFENITQNYIKQLDITAYASSPRITVDGAAYPLMTYCTNCYPTTHGYLLLWADGAPEGTLSAATSVICDLKISRINAGTLDPIVDTGKITIPIVK